MNNINSNSRTISLPIPDGFDKDIEWLNANINNDGNDDKIISCETIDLSGSGGLSGASMFRLVLNKASGTTKTLVCKLTPQDKQERSKELGQARESIFYESFSDSLKSIGLSIPSTYYCYGNMQTGEKQIILDDLSDCIQAGYFYGNHSPHNWGKDLNQLISPCNQNLVAPLSEQEWVEVITRKAFNEAAKLHSLFWKRKEYLQLKWLRSADWIVGEGEESWTASQQTAVKYWENTKEKIKTKADYGVCWSPLVIECMEASISKISFSSYQAERSSASYQWTLVHGDYHPANLMFKSLPLPLSSNDGNKANGIVYLLDWEMVGLGSGPQDLAQYIISHVSSETRRLCELRLLREYYDALLASNETITNDTFSWDDCVRDYSHGGAERWIWLLPLLAEMCSDQMTQFFHDQLQHFLEDHRIDGTNIGMPRV